MMNFNDYGSALVVLFQQMVVNNWYVVVNMTVSVVGHTTLVRIYFITFYVVVCIVLVNIMIAIVLEL